MVYTNFFEVTNGAYVLDGAKPEIFFSSEIMRRDCFFDGEDLLAEVGKLNDRYLRRTRTVCAGISDVYRYVVHSIVEHCPYCIVHINDCKAYTFQDQDALAFIIRCVAAEIPTLILVDQFNRRFPYLRTHIGKFKMMPCNRLAQITQESA